MNELITKEQVLETESEDDLFEFMAHNNSQDFNLNKATEEIFEFGEALTKLRTKSVKNPKRPSPMDALTEFGDVILRGRIALKTLFPDNTFDEIDDMVIAHIEKKTTALMGWLRNGKYDRGL